MCRAGGMCAAQEVFCGVCAAQEVIMFRVGGMCGCVCAAAGLYLWATVVWGFDTSAAEFPQPKKTRVFGVNRPLV